MLTHFSFYVYNVKPAFEALLDIELLQMKFRHTTIADVIVFEPQILTDERGFFAETYRSSWFETLNTNPQFVQDNHSLSLYGTLRGMHLQKEQPQGKLVRVSRGEVFNVAVDMRLDSPFYGQWAGEYLSASNYHVMWIPPGFANGFITLSDAAELLYKCTEYYHRLSECSLLWNDPVLAIRWPVLQQPLIDNPVPGDHVMTMSAKDKAGRPFMPGMGFRQGVWVEPGQS